MLQGSQAFNGFAVKDLAAARTCYGDSLGLQLTDVPDMGPLARLHLGERDVLLYEQPSATPASYTFLNGPDIAWFKDPSGNVLSVIAQD